MADKVFSVDEFVNQGAENSALIDSYKNFRSINNRALNSSYRASYLNSPNFKVNFDESLGAQALRDDNFWRNEFLAINQSTSSKWANGVVKALGNTALYTAGNLGGYLYGIPAWIGTGEFSRFYDNDFSRLMDKGSEGLNEAMPNYMTREEQNYGVLRSMGTANFWANDIMGGMAFTMAAILSETIASAVTMATFGAAAPMQAAMTVRILTQANKVMRALNKTTKIADAGLDLASTASKIGKISRGLGTTTRQLLTGAGYEAGVEARHFVDEAQKDYISRYYQEFGKEPSAEELASEMDKIHSAANGVFGTNLALVGYINFLTLPKTFGKGLSRTAPVYSGGSNSILGKIKTALNPTSIGRSGANTEWELAFNNWSKARKVGYYTQHMIKRPIYEGLVEEGGQGLINRAALDYVARRYSPDGAVNAYTLGDAIGDAFSETYGDSGNTQFRKEIAIGMIIGALGSPTFRSFNVFKDGWQGSSIGAFREIQNKNKEAQEYVDFINKNKVTPFITEAIKTHNSNYESAALMDEAIAKNDFFEAKNRENAQVFSIINSRYQMGQVDTVIEDFSDSVSKMDAEEFGKEFGYENMTKEELDQRKKEVTDKLKDKVFSVRDALQKAEGIVRDMRLVAKDEKGEIIDTVDNQDLKLALAYNIDSTKNLDKREAQIFSELSKTLGIDPRTLKEIRDFNLKIKGTSNWVDIYSKESEKLEKEKAKVQRYLDMSTRDESIAKNTKKVAEAQAKIKAQQAKVDAQQKKVDNLIEQEILNRESGGTLQYKYDKDEFKKQADELVKLREKAKASYGLTPEIAVETEIKYNDLLKIAEQRENFVKELQSLMSREGAKMFKDDLAAIKKDAWKITKKELAERYKRNLQALALSKAENGTIQSQEEAEAAEKVLKESLEESNALQNLPKVPASKKLEKSKTDEVLNNTITSFEEIREELNSDNKTLGSVRVSIKKLKQLQTTVNSKLSEEGISEESKDLYEDLNNEISNLLDYATEVEKAFSKVSDSEKVPPLNVKSLLRIIVDKEDEEKVMKLLRNSSWESIRDNLRIVKERYKDAGKEVPLKTPSGQPIEGPITMTLGDGLDSGYYLYFGPTKLGGITDPARFNYDGEVLDPNDVTQVKALVGSDPVQIRKFQEYYYAADKLFKKVDKGTATSKDIAKVFGINVSSPGFYMVSRNDSRPLLSDFMEDPKFSVRIGEDTGVLITNNNNNRIYLYTKDGRSIDVSSKKAAISMLSKATKKSPNIAKMRHGWILLAPVQDTVVPLGLDYTASSSVSEEDFEKEIMGFYNEISKMTEEELQNEYDETGAIIRNSDKFFTVHNPQSPTSKLDIEVKVKRTYKDGEFKSAQIVPVLKTQDAEEWLYGLLKVDEGGNLTVNWSEYSRAKGETVYYSEPYSKDVLIEAMNQRMKQIAFVNRKNQNSVIRAITNGRKEKEITVRDIKEKIVTYDPKTNLPENFGDLELAALPKGANTESPIYLHPREAIFEKLDSKEKEKVIKKAKKKSKDSAKVSDSEGGTINTHEGMKNVGDILSNGSIVAGEIPGLNGKPSPVILSKSQLIENVYLLMLGNIDPSSRFPKKVLDFAGVKFNKNTLEFSIKNSEGKVATTKFTGEVPVVKKSKSSSKPAKKKGTKPLITPAKNAQELFSKTFKPEEEEDEENEEDVVDENENTDDIELFSLESYGRESVRMDQAIKILSSILPLKTKDNPNGLITVAHINNLKKRLTSGKIPFGAFYNSVIYLNTNRADRGVVYHEAFHAVMAVILSPSERGKVYLEAFHKYGNPSTEDFKKLRNLSPKYITLSDNELTRIWLEEKLADDFAKYSTKKEQQPKTWIGRLFKRISDWFKSFRNVESDFITGFFDSILSGTYSDYSGQNNELFSKAPLFSTLRTLERIVPEEFKTTRLSPRKNLTREESDIIISRVAQEVLKLKPDNFNKFDDSVLREAIENVKEFYSEDNWIDEITYLMDSSPIGSNEHWKVADKVTDMKNALSYKKNLKDIKKEVVKILQAIDPDYEFEVEDTPERSFDKFIGEDTGFKTLTRRIKSILLTTNYSADEFNIGLSEEELSGEKYQVPINVHRTYYNIQKGLVGVKEQDFLERLEYLAEFDEQTRAFFYRVLADIAEELGIQYDTSDIYTLDQIINLPDTELKKSNTFNSLLTNFSRTRSDIKEILYDPIKKDFILTSANTKDAAETQLASWANNFANIHPEEYFNIANELLGEVKMIYYADEDDTASMSTWIKELDAQSFILKSKLNTLLGMELHESYIKWSMIKDNLDKIYQYKAYLENLNNEVESTLPQLTLVDKIIGFYDVFKDAGMNSLDEKLENKSGGVSTGLLFGILPSNSILKRTVGNGNPYTYKGTTVTETEKALVRNPEEGALTRLRNIAASNAVIDPSVRPTSYQNVEGKNIWDIVYRSYYSDMHDLFKTEDFKNYIKQIKDGSATWKNLKEILNSHGMEYPDRFIQNYHHFIQRTPLIKSSDQNILFGASSNLFNIGGLREVSLDSNKRIKRDAEYREGKTWKHMDAKSKVLVSLAFFSESKTKEGTEYALYNFNINEGKSTTFAVELPKFKAVNSKGLTSTSKTYMHELMLAEFYRIRREFNNIKNVANNKDIKFLDYNYTVKNGQEYYEDDEAAGVKLRAHNFNDFKWIEEFSPNTFNKLLNLARSNEKINEEKLLEELSPIYEEYINSIYNDFIDILDSPSVRAIRRDGEDLKNDILPKYFENEDGTINEEAIKNFIVNDYIQTISYNNLLHGDTALGTKNFTDFVKRNAGSVAYGPPLGVGTSKIAIIKSITNDPRVPGEDITNGQSYCTEAWEMHTYLKSLGKLNGQKIIDIIKRKRMGYELTDKEISYLTSSKAMSQSKKLVGHDHIIYWKTSVAPILRSSVSFVPYYRRKELDMYYEQLFDAEERGDSEAIKDAYENINEIWQPLPHRKELHDLLRKMELEGVDIVAFDSAIKKAQPNVTSSQASLNPFTINNKFIREQVITDGFKTMIVHGTQLMQLIWSEQDPKAILNFLGKGYSAKDLSEYYKKLLALRVNQGFENLKDALFHLDAKGNIIIKPKYKKLYDSFIRSIESSNANPYLMELFSLDLFDNPNYNANFTGVSTKFFQMFLAYASQDVLKHKTSGSKYTLQSDFGFKVLVEKETGRVVSTNEMNYKKDYTTRKLEYNPKTGVAEAIISSNVAKLYNLKKGQAIPKNVAKQLGFRIPTQDKHSMIKLRVVDILPANTMNTIIVHPKVIELSGADFDIDSLFARMYETFGNYTKFGNYLTTGKIEDAIKEIKHSKRIREKLKDYLNESRIPGRADIIEMLDGETSEEEISAKMSEEIKAVRESFYNKEGLSKDADILKILNPELYNTIKNNIKNSNKKGATKINPLTLEETNNLLLDLEYEFINNAGNSTISHTPASFDIFKDVEKLWKEKGLEYSTEKGRSHDIVSKFNSMQANDAGNDGIGPAALINVALQNVLNSDIELPGAVLGSDKMTNMGEGLGRTNNVNSTVISGMTDNPKHLYSKTFNLNSNTVSFPSLMAALGIGYKTSFSFMRQSVFTYFSDLSERRSSPVNKKSNRNWLYEAFDDPEKMFKEFLKDSGSSLTLKKLEDVSIEINLNNLLEALVYEKNPQNSKLSEEQYYKLQFSVLLESFKLKSIAQEFLSYATVLSLIKGYSTDPHKINSLVEELSNLGIKASLEGEKVVLTKTKKEVWIDWEKVINSNPLTVKNIEVALNIKKMLGYHLIPFSEKGQELVNSIVKNGDSKKLTRADEMGTIIRAISSLVMLKTKNQKYSVKELFSPKFHNKYDELLEEAKKDPSSPLYNNAFLLSLVKDHSIRKNLITYNLVTNTRSSITSDRMSAVMDGFYLLRQVEPDFAKAAIRHLIIKDGLQYKNSSYLSSIDPRVFKDGLIRQLNEVQDAFANGDIKTIEKIYGKSFEELKVDFIESFLLNPSNFKLRKNISWKSFSRAISNGSKILYKKVTQLDLDSEEDDGFIQAYKEAKKEQTPQHFSPITYTIDKTTRKVQKLSVSLLKHSNKSVFKESNKKKANNEEKRAREQEFESAIRDELTKGLPFTKEFSQTSKGAGIGALGFPLVFKIVDIKFNEDGSTQDRSVLMRLSKVNYNPFPTTEDKFKEPIIGDGKNIVIGFEAIYEPVTSFLDSLPFSTYAVEFDEAVRDIKEIRDNTKKAVVAKKSNTKSSKKVKATEMLEDEDPYEDDEVEDEIVPRKIVKTKKPSKKVGKKDTTKDDVLKAIANMGGMPIYNLSAGKVQSKKYNPEDLPEIEDTNEDECLNLSSG